MFKALVEQGKATVTEGEGDHGADAYRWLAGTSAAATPFATVNLAPDAFNAETTNSHVWKSYTWELAICADASGRMTAASPSSPSQLSSPDSQTSLGRFDEVDPPPERSD